MLVREELQAEIDKLEEQIVGIAVNNPRVVEEYRKRLAEIDKLDKDISKQQEELDALRAEIDELKVGARQLQVAAAVCYHNHAAKAFAALSLGQCVLVLLCLWLVVARCWRPGEGAVGARRLRRQALLATPAEPPVKCADILR